MARNFPNFIDAYFDYANDDFCPIDFHKWTGISVVAAALERKITLRQGKIHHVPNIYVVLVSHAAVGKSTAMDVGMDLIEELKKTHNTNFRIIPNQATEPALVDMMKIIEYFPVGDGRIQLPHSSGFFFASEASASALQNTCGDFVATLTAFYDCPKFFRKKLKGEQHPTQIENVCMNMLAGATFNYLKELVNERSVMGGFASRLIYVVSKERKVREIVWGESHEVDAEKRALLVADLAQINKLSGPVTATKGFIKRFEKWQPDFDREMIAMKSERMESIIARKGTNLIKLAIIHSVSESNDLIVTEEHFDKAKDLMDQVTANNNDIVTHAMISNPDSQQGLTQLLLRAVKDAGGVTTIKALKSSVFQNGNNVGMVKETIDYLISSGNISLNGDNVKLLVDPDTYL